MLGLPKLSENTVISFVCQGYNDQGQPHIPQFIKENDTNWDQVKREHLNYWLEWGKDSTFQKCEGCESVLGEHEKDLRILTWSSTYDNHTRPSAFCVKLECINKAILMDGQKYPPFHFKVSVPLHMNKLLSTFSLDSQISFV